MLILVPTVLEARSLLEGAVPTSEQVVTSRVAGRDVRAALCGFGPVGAGVLATLALERERPGAVVLAGLGGTLAPERLPVGAVLAATSVSMAEVGRNHGPTALLPSDLGLPQAPARGGSPAVFERIDLEASGPPGTVPGALLTVPWSSASPVHGEERRHRHPRVLAEDMEGFPVALAARRLGVPLTILRAISNVAGAPRSSWIVPDALERLAGVLATAVAAVP